MRLAESKPKGEIEGEKKLPLEVQPTLPATLHAAGWYQVITRLQHPNAKAYWHGLKPQEVEEADWEKSRHRLIATAILFAEMPGCVAYAPRHWRDSRSTFGGGLERSQRWHSRKWFGGTTPFWTLVQWAKSGVITPPSMPHGIAMAFVDGLSDDALISSPQWVGGGVGSGQALSRWPTTTGTPRLGHQRDEAPSGATDCLEWPEHPNENLPLSAEASRGAGDGQCSPSWHVREHSRTQQPPCREG